MYTERRRTPMYTGERGTVIYTRENSFGGMLPIQGKTEVLPIQGIPSFIQGKLQTVTYTEDTNCHVCRGRQQDNN